MKILNGLQDWERLTVADALESVSFEKGDCIGKLHKYFILGPIRLDHRPTGIRELWTPESGALLYTKV